MIKLYDKDDLKNIYRLKSIIRYNNRIRIKDESVAEHSFFVAFLVLDICDKLQLTDDITFACMKKAILHDLPEIDLNDITYDTKIKLNLHDHLKLYEDEYFDKNVSKHAYLMKNDVKNVINLVVEYADALSVLQYANNEIELGNTSMKSVTQETIKRLVNIEKDLEKLL